MPLSEFTIRHARTTGQHYSLGDFDGLSLMVTAAGGKRWLFRFNGPVSRSAWRLAATLQSV